jgi:hypothetical protein
MALGTGQRNIAAALVVASQSFDDPKVVVMGNRCRDCWIDRSHATFSRVG